MDKHLDINEIDTKIRQMKKSAEELDRLADKFPALSRNVARIMASIKMLELNISDIVDI